MIHLQITIFRKNRQQVRDESEKTPIQCDEGNAIPKMNIEQLR